VTETKPTLPSIGLQRDSLSRDSGSQEILGDSSAWLGNGSWCVLLRPASDLALKAKTNSTGSSESTEGLVPLCTRHGALWNCFAQSWAAHQNPGSAAVGGTRGFSRMRSKIRNAWKMGPSSVRTSIDTWCRSIGEMDLAIPVSDFEASISADLWPAGHFDTLMISW